MSSETALWLNQNTMKGFTAPEYGQGHAWHNRHDIMMLDGLDNHYEHEIPAEDIHRRLFNFDVVGMPVYLNTPMGLMPVEGKQAWVRDDTYAALGIHSETYNGHGYGKWLVEDLNRLVDGRARYGSAGLLRGGAVAWVQIEVPETLRTDLGVDFRPHILCGTSFDGSLATFYKPCFTLTVCDNTMNAAMGEAGDVYRVKHTSRSAFVLADAKSAIRMIDATAENVAKQIDALVNVEVTDKMWSDFITAHAPIVEGSAKATVTRAENKRMTLTGLWNVDARVSPWRNTAWGVVQAVNTFNEHLQSIRGADKSGGLAARRFERKMSRAISGEIGNDDNAALKTLSGIVGRELIMA